MKRKYTGFFAGLLCGAVIFGGGAACAAGVLAERSSHKVTVDGVPVSVEAYVINGNNYFQLRDLGKLLDVGVAWNNATRTVEISTSEGYTEEEPGQTATKPSTGTSETDLYDVRVEIVELTNALRRQNGVPALTMDDDLMAAAQVRADEIAATLAYRHERPDGSKIDTVVSNTGTLLMGENIGAKDYRILNDPAELAQIQVDSWNNSQGHHDNILRTKYHSTGVGIAQDRYGMYYVVQIFTLGDYTITGIDEPIIP